MDQINENCWKTITLKTGGGQGKSRLCECWYILCSSCRMLDDFSHEVDNTQSRLDNVMKKLAKVSHMTSGNLPLNTVTIFSGAETVIQHYNNISFLLDQIYIQCCLPILTALTRDQKRQVTWINNRPIWESGCVLIGWSSRTPDPTRHNRVVFQSCWQLFIRGSSSCVPAPCISISRSPPLRKHTVCFWPGWTPAVSSCTELNEPDRKSDTGTPKNIN